MGLRVEKSRPPHPADAVFSSGATRRGKRLSATVFTLGSWSVLLIIGYLFLKQFI